MKKNMVLQRVYPNVPLVHKAGDDSEYWAVDESVIAVRVTSTLAWYFNVQDYLAGHLML